MNQFWQLNIEIDAVDGFLYMGKLFLVRTDGTLRTVDLKSISSKYLSKVDGGVDFADNTFFNNHIAERKRFSDSNWTGYWDQFAAHPIFITINTDTLPVLTEVEASVLDVKIYGQKIILATRAGVFEAPIDFENETPNLSRSLQKVFDSKSTFLSAKAGEVFISCVDGLFRGSYWNENNRLKVIENAIEECSQRTNWRLYDLINFEESSIFNFYYNDIEKANSDEFKFLQDDGERDVKKIKSFGIHQFSSSELFSSKININEVIFAFNSNNYIFVVMGDGSLKYFNFNHANYSNDLLQVNDVKTITKFDLQNFGSPINAQTVPLGTVFEFFDKVVLVKKGTFIIEDEPITSMRAYPNSKWYKNIVMTFKASGVTITALNPFL